MISQHYPFQLIPLPYDYSDLEPYIDTLTMIIHHDRHLKTYVENSNKALEKYSEYHSWSIEKLLQNFDKLPSEIVTAVRNNVGGVYNHNVYFYGLSGKKDDMPTGDLKDKIIKDFGSYEDFKEKFKQQGLKVFGSGYAWLILDRNGKLSIVGSSNQDSPITQGFLPILCLDVWEHAYYLKHYNKRMDYIDDWFEVVNWKVAEDNYLKAVNNLKS